MGSPFPLSFSSPGEGHVVVQLRPPAISALSTFTFQYPLKLISLSSSSSSPSALIFLLTYGGGLVGGDAINLIITVLPDARLSLATQGYTKIFKSPSREVVSRQHLYTTIHSGAAVCLLPDPVQPFAGSVYEQYQVFVLASGASLCLLDWVYAGRTARDEDWDLWAWSSCNELWTGEKEKALVSGSEKDSLVKKRLLLRDKVVLEGDHEGMKGMALKTKMTGLGVFGTLVVKGPIMEDLAGFFIEEFTALPRIGAQDFRSQESEDVESSANLPPREKWRRTRLTQEKEDDLLWSATRVRGSTVVKFGAKTVEGARSWIGSMIKEEGSIEKRFGDAALICIR